MKKKQPEKAEKETAAQDKAEGKKGERAEAAPKKGKLRKKRFSY